MGRVLSCIVRRVEDHVDYMYCTKRQSNVAVRRFSYAQFKLGLNETVFDKILKEVLHQRSSGRISDARPPLGAVDPPSLDPVPASNQLTKGGGPYWKRLGCACVVLFNGWIWPPMLW